MISFLIFRICKIVSAKMFKVEGMLQGLYDINLFVQLYFCDISVSNALGKIH